MKRIYWFLPIIILIFQIIYSSHMAAHIRQEELTESVSNVYWLQAFRNVCSGITTNIGWYGQLAAVYNIFGFSLAAVKIYKLFLFVISLFCLAYVLKKFMGEKLAWFPLLTIGFSPTLIYFNSLSIHFGSDLIYFPIALFLALSVDFSRKIFDYLKQVVLWAFCMIAWMSYPTFVYYLPVIGGLYLYKLFDYKSVILRQKAEESLLNLGKKSRSFVSLRMTIKKKISFVFISLFSFFTPLVLTILYVRDRGVLLFDHATHSGIFRGNGSFNFNLSSIWENMRTTLVDLFVRSNSYYFELPKVEFSGIYPIISVLVVFGICGYFAFKKKKVRSRSFSFPPLTLSFPPPNLSFPPPNLSFPRRRESRTGSRILSGMTKKMVAALLIYLFLCVLLTSLTGELGGLRRATNLLAIFYALFALSWYFVASIAIAQRNVIASEAKRSKEKIASSSASSDPRNDEVVLRVVLMGFLGLLFVHHVLAFGTNLSYLNKPSVYSEGSWFSQRETPQKSLDAYVDQVQKGDLSLVCVDDKKQPTKCSRFGYNLVYPAIAGTCQWNGLLCHQVLIYDFGKGEMAPLDLECWRDDL